MRSFLLVKTKPGMEKEILDRFKALLEVREIHLITGKFDLLVALESEETEIDPRQRVAEVVIDKVRKAGGVIDTRTIIPIEAEVHPSRPPERPTQKGFVFVMSEAGKEKGLMSKLMALPEVRGVYLLFGKADVLAELEVEKSFVNPPPKKIASLVENKIAKLGAVHDTDTYVPLESIVKWPHTTSQEFLRPLVSFGQMLVVFEQLAGSRILRSSFFARDTVEVARNLLGKYLVRTKGSKRMVGWIVEVEAYFGSDDPASHAFAALPQEMHRCLVILVTLTFTSLTGIITA